MVLLVAVSAALLTAEPIEIVGADAIASLKVAVTVILLSADFTVLSESLDVMVTVGAEVSTVKVMLCVPDT